MIGHSDCRGKDGEVVHSLSQQESVGFVEADGDSDCSVEGSGVVLERPDYSEMSDDYLFYHVFALGLIGSGFSLSVFYLQHGFSWFGVFAGLYSSLYFVLLEKGFFAGDQLNEK